MKNNFNNKKLLKTALYTSPLIAILCFDQSLGSPVPVLTAVLIASIVVLCIWFINFGVYYVIEEYGYGKHTNQLRYLLSYVLLFGLISLIKYYVNPSYLEVSNNPPLAMFFSINAIILIIQNLHIVKEKKSIVELENARLKLKHAEAMNQKLKQQIHPHFLFNSLNTLKTLTKKTPRTATDYVVWLSRFLRSSLLSTNKNTIKLSEELNLCTNYLEMQKIRFQSSLVYRLNIPDKVRNSGFVLPFSIQLLLENAIKHNAMSRESPLHIQVLYEDGWIKVCNNKQERIRREPSSGMGLDNLADRYQILTDDEIVIEQDNDQFLVCIKVLDQERSVYSPEEYETLVDQ